MGRDAQDTHPKKLPAAASPPFLSLPRERVSAIIRERTGRHRCAEYVHHALKNRGVVVSLSSVKRTLERCNLTKKWSPWKRPHDFASRPVAVFPGALVEMDTVHIIAPDRSKIYIYTLIDLYSRWAYAEVARRIGARCSASFLLRAQKKAPFGFSMVQTKHGSEFSARFTHGAKDLSTEHRPSRVRQKDDQAHIQRFNRTIQEECFD